MACWIVSTWLSSGLDNRLRVKDEDSGAPEADRRVWERTATVPPANLERALYKFCADSFIHQSSPAASLFNTE